MLKRAPSSYGARGKIGEHSRSVASQLSSLQTYQLTF